MPILWICLCNASIAVRAPWMDRPFPERSQDLLVHGASGQRQVGLGLHPSEGVPGVVVERRARSIGARVHSSQCKPQPSLFFGACRASCGFYCPLSLTSKSCPERQVKTRPPGVGVGRNGSRQLVPEKRSVRPSRTCSTASLPLCTAATPPAASVITRAARRFCSLGSGV